MRVSRVRLSRLPKPWRTMMTFVTSTHALLHRSFNRRFNYANQENQSHRTVIDARKHLPLNDLNYCGRTVLSKIRTFYKVTIQTLRLASVERVKSSNWYPQPQWKEQGEGFSESVMMAKNIHFKKFQKAASRSTLDVEVIRWRTPKRNWTHHRQFKAFPHHVAVFQKFCIGSPLACTQLFI